MRTVPWLAGGLAAWLAAQAVIAAQPAEALEDRGSAQALRAGYAALADKPASGPFGKPIHLRSSEEAGRLAGDVHAVIDHPFATVRNSLRDARSWCDILILHPNIKSCQTDAAGATSAASFVEVHLGNAELPVRFAYEVAAAGSDYLDVRLYAPEGPFGTTDYRVALSAAPLDAGHTILHMTYAHGYGTRARLAMQAYFRTLGRGKVGFTIVGRGSDGEPLYATDFRGGLERNVMRYYFAIEAYLDTLSSPRDQRLERRLAAWLAQIERHPRQLREEDGYAERKRREMQRQQLASAERG